MLARRGTVTEGEARQALAELLRAIGRDVAATGAILTLVLAGLLVRLPAGPALDPLGLPILLAEVGAFLISAGYAVRTRVVIRRALERLRERSGAPLHPGVPWEPLGSSAALDERELRRELRHLVSTACRCHDLSLNALVWALITGLLAVLWHVM
ncbi:MULTISPECIES: hypothetical protein [Thermomonospora]|uniref:Uncharacterized protein n=1 Tax=Thermomonospora curvata (strain ATCC 19995 / DSM 43183 / JCM 3096 / KCTC 9072 / NBRC 15933 / NCIMB 10081 / Henssen B9) TaxID=471852 RepID=D1A1R8_THECD|nr:MULTISPECIES: hypothetical protein [Thermomonospora]ACY97756.1 hypothetical protein Tcur_2190 [Thermomonospora curvata DSM 43183]PKK14054.1 MAG: hypothetical protein BUE48_010715 [Thermomonospora sp. CIF 1]